jgi:hypothetical protein
MQLVWDSDSGKKKAGEDEFIVVDDVEIAVPSATCAHQQQANSKLPGHAGALIPAGGR